MSTSSELASFDLSSSSPLIDPLNTLLDRLSLPFVLDTPLDLTPSLLLAILESLLQSRLPISSSIRESRSDVAKIQAMKIFLGVLETDVLSEDVGLSDIDPRRLAAGEWEEVVFIAQLLCWLGKQMGLLPSQSRSPTTFSTRRSSSTMCEGTETTESTLDVRRIASPSMRSTATNSITSGFSFDREYQESDTTVQSLNNDVMETPRPRSERILPEAGHRYRPHCIHEIEDPSFLAQEDEEELLRAEHDSVSHDNDDMVDAFCDCFQDEGASSTFYLKDRPSRSVRYDGYIQEVDTDLELRTFETRKVTKKLHVRSASEKPEAPHMPRYPASEKCRVTRHTSPSHHALALLDERANLLSKLASLGLNTR
ncbi:hypothetical protein B0F90DRAFT_1625659 [Multifurca ochricompacta]|uniref:DUF5745 domain-containing protein n=1 Tax=Multifurca ochricompacta TaxID=376703 RepID=A0AAD4M6R1_9AGAM|nr:hypothetical protein B0F90DRAFT_1625659 [Multifurca ochricompacta]